LPRSPARAPRARATTRRPALAAFAAIFAAVPLALVTPAPAAAQGIAGPYLAASQAERQGDLAEAAERFAAVLARDPNNPVIVNRAMLHQVGAGKIVQAMALARRLEQLSPGSHLARLMITVDAARRGDFEEVLERFSENEDRQNVFVGHLVEAWGAFGTGDVARARSVLTAMNDEGIGGPAGQYIAVYHLALLESAAGDDDAAIAHLGEASELAGLANPRLARIKAGALARLGRMEEARAALADPLSATLSDARLERLDADLAAGKRPEPVVTTAEDGLAEALFAVAQFILRRDRLAGIAHARLATHLRPDLIEAHLTLGDEFRRTQQYDLAIAAYDAVPESAPEALDARIGAAEARESAGDTDAAVAGLAAVIANWPDSVEAHTALGDVLRRNERFEEAAAAYDGAIALIGEPERRHWVLLYQRGIAYERSDQWALAEADLKKALELEPDQPQVLNYLGYSWVELRINLDEAKAMIEKAVEQRPDDGYIVDSLGWVLFRLGDFDGAVEHLGHAVELRPVDAVINDHYGDALWMVGRETEARFQWRRALSFDPEPEEEERIRRKLELGLDKVLAEEKAAGNPAIIGQSEEKAPEGNDGG